MQDLDTRFAYRPPRTDEISRFESIRSSGKALASLIVELTPSSREQSLALTKIEEAVMWANAAITRHPEEADGT